MFSSSLLIGIAAAEVKGGQALADVTLATRPITLSVGVETEVWLSKALLYGIGFTLFGLILGAFWDDPQARAFPAWLKQQIVGGDPVMNGAKSIINFYLTSVATISCLLSASIIFKNPLMWPFAITTIALGALAIYEGTQR